MFSNGCQVNRGRLRILALHHQPFMSYNLPINTYRPDKNRREAVPQLFKTDICEGRSDPYWQEGTDSLHIGILEARVEEP